MNRKLRHQIFVWVNAWCGLADSLITIVTLKQRTNFQLRHLAHYEIIELEDKIYGK